MAHQLSHAAPCLLCDGPCREPWTLPEIHDNYPFLPLEVIAMTKQDQAPQPEPKPKSGRRAVKPGENRVKPHGENR